MILVDPLHTNPPDVLRAKRLPKSMAQTCHLVATEGRAEELAFIRQIGVLPRWLHHTHYDLNPAKRALAVQLGAVETTTFVVACRHWRRRERFVARGEPFDCLCGTCPEASA